MRAAFAVLLVAGLLGAAGIAAAEEMQPVDPIKEIASAIETVVKIPIKLIEDVTK
jgi:hypothetical protein